MNLPEKNLEPKTQSPTQDSSAKGEDIQTDLEQGLSTEEALQRFQRYGPNALVEEKVSTLHKLLTYFWGPIPWMIETAACDGTVNGGTFPPVTLYPATSFWCRSGILCRQTFGFWPETISAWISLP